MKDFMFRILCGFLLGISVFAPGVSGSVMAIIMGIYEKLITIIAHPFHHFKKNVVYLLPMLIGAAASAVLFVYVFSFLFKTFELVTYLFFIGLIVGTVPSVFRNANQDGFKKHYLIGIIAAFAVAFIAGIVGAQADAAHQVSSLSTNLVYLGFCGAIAGLVSMVPGMSISMILMVLGVYEALLFAAESLNLVVIAVVGVCFLIAMVLSSRLIKTVFKKWHGFASFMVFGFMLGSIGGIFFGLPAPGPDFNWLAGILAVIGGLAISLIFVRLAKKFNVEEREEEARAEADADTRNA